MLIKFLLPHLLLIVLGFFSFVGLTRPGLIDIEILFYRGLVASAVVAAGQALVAILGRRWFPSPRIAFATASLALTLSINISFLVLFPVTIDRSISVYLLSELYRSAPDGGKTLSELEQTFVDDYVRRLNQIDRRMKEQIASGNVERINDHFVLTEQGRRFIRTSRTMAKIFQTDPSFVGIRTSASRPADAAPAGSTAPEGAERERSPW